MLTRRHALAMTAAAAAAPGLAHAAETTAHDFAFPGIDGGTVRLVGYAGGPILIVNTASRCGFTHQYDGLQALYDRFRNQGLTVLGVPSNDFRQELADEASVKHFCEVNFGIDFPMTAITPVTGTRAHPFYAWARDELGARNAPSWNFHKYLVGPDGKLIAAFSTSTKPEAPQVVSKVEAALASG